jgi:hypothetical protein
MTRTTGLLVALALVAATVLGCGGDGGSTGGMTQVGGVQASIEDIQQKIFTPRCALSGCHTGPAPQNGLDLTQGQALANLINVPATWDPNYLRVEPMDPTDSYLYMKLVGDPRVMGERMPKGGPFLNNDELGAIFEWIDGGSRPRPGY